MAASEFLQQIKRELENGRKQWRRGDKVLAAFGYARRWPAVISTINGELRRLGLKTDPPIDEHMPLTTAIRFYAVEESATDSQAASPPLAAQALTEDHVPDAQDSFDEVNQEEDTDALIIPSFKVAELRAASKQVTCIAQDASLSEAFTIMQLNKFSQLVVANNAKPRAQDIRGIVSFQSIAKTFLLNSSPKHVRDCLDTSVPQVSTADEIGKVVDHLSEHEVVLVIGPEKRLSGIITAWDLAEEFEKLVDPFKRIAEIESRLGYLIVKRLGKEPVFSFLKLEETSPSRNGTGLTVGELQRVFESPDLWGSLTLPYDRKLFVDALNTMRELRNRLMHFGEPLTEEETRELTNFCHMIRDIPLPEEV